jgi:hypothetical protein
VGEYPYDEVITFGKANITEPAVSCTAFGGRASCVQKSGGTIKAPIYAETA